MNTKDLLNLTTAIADRHFDGHLTIMRFTTEWKACFGTVDLDSPKRDNLGRTPGRRYVWGLPGFKTLEEALEHLVVERPGALDVDRGHELERNK